MASTTKWVTNLRQSIKNTCGTGWSVRGRESKGELITQVTFRYPDKQGRTAANVNLAWNVKNTTKIITAIEQLNDLMTQKNLSLQKAIELRMEPISQDKDNNFSTWEALVEDYLNNIELSKQDVLPVALFTLLKPELDNINSIRMQEGGLYSDKWEIAGRVDCIAEYKGKLSVIDFKTSTKEKQEQWIENYFIQGSAYCLSLIHI